MKRVVSFIIMLSMLPMLMVSPAHAKQREYIYTWKDDVFSSYGRWGPGMCGYKLEECTYAEAGEDVLAQWSLGLTAAEKYTIYVWRVLSDKGSADAQVSIELTTDKYIVPFSMAAGIVGWEKIGTYALPDGRVNVKLTGKTGRIIASAIKVVQGEVTEESADKIFLKVADTRFYKNGKLNSIDTAPQIVNDRTFVPVRFIAEAIGASVEWNDGAKEAKVTLGDKALVFKVGSDEYLSKNENKKLDAEVFISNDRTMLPLRAIGEDFDCEVLWDESGVIVILPQKASEQNKSDALNEALNIFK